MTLGLNQPANWPPNPEMRRPGLNSREWTLHNAGWLLLGVLALSVLGFGFGVAGLVVGSRALALALSFDERLRMIETKINPMAFKFRCDECGMVHLSDSSEAEECRVCRKQRRFCFVGRWE